MSPGPARKKGAKVQVLREDDLPVAVRPLQILANWGVGLADVAPVDWRRFIHHGPWCGSTWFPQWGSGRCRL